MVYIKVVKAAACIIMGYASYKLWKNYHTPSLEFEDVLFTGEDSLDCQSDDKINCIGCGNDRCHYANMNSMLTLLRSSKKSISLSMYIIANDRLTDAIIKAKKRGVYVRVITDHTMLIDNQFVEKMIRKGKLKPIKVNFIN